MCSLALKHKSKRTITEIDNALIELRKKRADKEEREKRSAENDSKNNANARARANAADASSNGDSASQQTGS